MAKSSRNRYRLDLPCVMRFASTQHRVKGEGDVSFFIAGVFPCKNKGRDNKDVNDNTTLDGCALSLVKNDLWSDLN